MNCPPYKKHPWAAIAVISGCLAICTCFISGSLGSRFAHHAETVHNQFAILKGQPHLIDGKETRFPQFQSRILFPLLLAGASKVGVFSDSQWFIIVRIATAFGAFAVFLLLCTGFEGMAITTACLGAGALAYALVPTFNHPWEHTTDFLDVGFMSAFIWLALQKQRMALALAVLAATLNHQTAAFAGVIWFCLWGIEPQFKPRWREAAYACALVLGSYSLSTAVKASLSSDKSAGYVINGWWTISQFADAIRRPEPYSWPILLLAMVAPVSLWLWANRSEVTGDIRRLLWASIWIVVLSSPIAYWSELRSVFLAPMVIATFVATASENRARRRPVAHFSEISWKQQASIDSGTNYS